MAELRRSSVAAGLALLLLGAMPAGAQEKGAEETAWPVSTPEAQGLDAGPLRALAARIRAGEFGNVDRRAGSISTPRTSPASAGCT
jgi:hypothetical protein